MKLIIHGERVCGVEVDPQTRCAHYHSDLDMIAIRFKCCGRWFPCYECHTEIADHRAQIWPAGERKTFAVLCGACGRQLSIEEYLVCDSTCPACNSKFNPRCANHYHLYFEMRDTS
ncbi:MAG: CHY zinc finger protein [Acidobacteriota bacterium]